MFKKPILTTIAIGSSLLLATSVLAFDLHSTTDTHANAKPENTSAEKPDSTPKQKDTPNQAEHKWRQHKDKKDMERREQVNALKAIALNAGRGISQDPERYGISYMG